MQSYSDYSTVIDALKKAHGTVNSDLLAVATEILAKRSVLNQDHLFYCGDVFWKSDFYVCVNFARLLDLVEVPYNKKYKRKIRGPRGPSFPLSAHSLGLGKYITIYSEHLVTSCEAPWLQLSRLAPSSVVPEFVGIPDDFFECAVLAPVPDLVPEVVVNIEDVDVGRCDAIINGLSNDPVSGFGFVYAIPFHPVMPSLPLVLPAFARDRATFRSVSPAVICSDQPRKSVDLWSTDWGGTDVRLRLSRLRHDPLDNPQLTACVNHPTVWAAYHLPSPVCSLDGAVSLVRLSHARRASPKRVKIKLNLGFDRPCESPDIVSARDFSPGVRCNARVFWYCIYVGLKDKGDRLSCWRRRKRRLTFVPPRLFDVA